MMYLGQEQGKRYPATRFSFASRHFIGRCERLFLTPFFDTRCCGPFEEKCMLWRPHKTNKQKITKAINNRTTDEYYKTSPYRPDLWYVFVTKCLKLRYDDKTAFISISFDSVSSRWRHFIFLLIVGSFGCFFFTFSIQERRSALPSPPTTLELTLNTSIR